MEGESERELEAEEDLDSLFVTCDSKQSTIENLTATIAELGYKAEFILGGASGAGNDGAPMAVSRGCK